MNNIELISIGDEILAGLTVNTNASWLAAELFKNGYRVRWITTIADNPKEIEAALKQAAQRATIVIITGGLGPTPDDTTRQALIRFFKTDFILHNPTLNNIQNLFEARNLKMPEINRYQAMVPRDAEVIDNPIGTAPGLLLRRNKSLYFFLPGVPTEMKQMFSESILTIIKNESTGQPIPSYLLRTTGLPESRLVEKISDILKKAPPFPISFLPKTSGVDIRISSRTTKDEIELENLVNELRDRLRKYIYTEDEKSLSEILGDLLTQKKLTLSVAESFTGGFISDLITDTPGSSAYFIGSAVTYNNLLKIKLLGVKKKTLETYGAVSKQTALEMVDGVWKRFSSDCALSSTGIAGPSGGTLSKPVGLCYLAARHNTKKTVKKINFGKNRRMNKERGAAAALELLRRLLIYG
jgi:nicotinamide-nucleotide amidase